MRHTFAAVCLTALVAGSADLGLARPGLSLVGEPVAPSSKAPSSAAPSSAAPIANAAPLERALGSITPERISADLYFIACDEMGGRDSPSVEQRIAARFIRNRLQRLGWQPGAPDGYLWEYELPKHQADFDKCRLTAKKGGETVELELGRYSFFPMMLSDAETTGGLVFVGQMAEDELAACDLKDKWALCYSGEMNFRERTRLAREAGAVGLLVASPLGEEDEMGERCEGYVETLREPSLRGGRGGFPYLYMAHSGVHELLDLAGLEALPAVGSDLGIELKETRGEQEGAAFTLENVCGFWPGSDPELSKEVLIVSAHYDHVGKSVESGHVFNGADDNGSGTCGLLSLAEALTEYGPMKRSVMLMWVSAEEKGLLGSRAWTKDPWLPEGTRPVLDINIDMIGRNASNQILITPTKDHEAYDFLTRVAEQHAPSEGFTDLGSADAYWRRSDHMNFYDNLNIPVCFLFTDVHEDYHKATDTPDKIDYDKAHRVVRLVVRMLDSLQGPTLEG